MFTGRSRDTLRDQLLAFWGIQYAATGQNLLTAPGSDAYNLAGAIGTMLEALEAQAEQTAHDILPDQASTEALNRHGYVDGIARVGTTVAQFDATVTNAVDGTVAVAGLLATYADGSTYTVTSTNAVITGGTGTIHLQAVLPGSASNRTAGQTLTFVSTPTGLNPTMTVQSGPVAGLDPESDASYAQRIIRARQERPASGNRADWRSWVEAFQGDAVATAYVYPLLAPPLSFPGDGTPATLGSVTVVAVGPTQGDNLTNTRIVPLHGTTTRSAGQRLATIEAYIEGTASVIGLPADGTQLRPVTMKPGSYCVQAINTTVVNLTMGCVMNAANAFPYGILAAPLVVSGTATSLVVAGDASALSGKRALIYPVVAAQRGVWESHVLGAANYDGMNTTFNQTSDPMLAGGAPQAGTTVSPAPPNYADLRTLMFAFFDALGPGDTTPASRWPVEHTGDRATCYLPALAAALMGVVTVPSTGAQHESGVLAAYTVLPGADVVPGPKTVVTLGEFLVLPD